MKIINVLIISIIMSFLSSCSTEPGIPRGEEAPVFQAQTIEGKSVSLSDYRGKVTMLYFWADWCPACKKEFPETQSYYHELKSEKFDLVAVNVGQAAEISKDFQEKFGAEFPMIADPDSKISGLYEVSELPTNYFLDAEGKVIRKITGWVSRKQVEVIINQNTPG